MSESLIHMLSKQHDDLKADLRYEITQLRGDISEWRADQAERFEKIEADVKGLLQLKWKIAGVCAAVVVMIEAGFELAKGIFH